MKREHGWHCLALLLTGLLLAASCSPERSRPGPPSISIDVGPGSTVRSPDTLSITVVANDPNGVDSLIVIFLDSTAIVDTDLRTEVFGFLRWPIPEGLDAGTVLTLSVRARDLIGQVAIRKATVTVVE